MFLTGKSIVVTGSGSGIGAAAALGAARAGAKVTVADIDETAGSALAAEIRDAGGEAQFVKVDISCEDDVRDMVAAAQRVFGGLHGAFNNAGIPSYSHSHSPCALADMPVEALRRSLDVNVVGTFLCMKYEIKAMLEAGGGAIVNTASNAGVLAIPSASDYVSAKHGVIGLTKAAALDYARQNVRVNAVLPGVTHSRMMEESLARNPQLLGWAKEVQPNGRIGQPQDVGDAALWLLSDAASFVTGISMHVDGGYAIV